MNRSDLAMCSPARIAPADLAEWDRLPSAVRDEVSRWMRGMEMVTKPIQAALERLAGEMRVSPKTARRLYDAWRHSGDWRVFVDRRKVKTESRRLSPEFVAWYRALCERNQRASAPAHREFQARWRRGEIIPGLDNSLPRHRLPPGTTYGNLQSPAYRPTRFEIVTMRLGRGAAAAYRPQVLTTRVGLHVGSHYMFDDLWHDNFVLFRGKPVRVLEFDAVDVFSGCKFAWGTQPRVQRDDGTMTNLKEHQMRLLLCQVLGDYGYSPRGTELIAEHGTAAIPEWVEELLDRRTGGLIRVRRSGMTGEEQAVAGMYLGQGGGNPRFKALLESLRNVFHNELASLPAQAGKNPDHRPEQTAGELDYATEIAQIGDMLPARVAQLLQLPILEYHSQFLPLLMGVYETLNARTWHRMEGWAECGHVVAEYRAAASVDHWLSPQEFLALPEAERAAVQAVVRSNPAVYARTRSLSPTEVHRAGRGELLRISPGTVCELLGPDMAREHRVDRGAFRFLDSEIHPEPLVYEARVRDEEGRETELRDGETYLLFVNPFRIDEAFVANAKGGFVGVARRDRRVSRADVEALQERFVRVAKREAELMVDLRRRHAGMTQERTAMRAHNSRVIKQAAAEAAGSEATADAALEDVFGR